MKHIFYVHSYITYFVTRKIIDLHALKPDEVVVLKARHVDIDFPFTSYTPPDLIYRVTPGNILKNYRKIRMFDRWVSAVTGGAEFVLYYPHTGLRELDCILTHKKCRGYSLMEEGTAAYNALLKPVPFTDKPFEMNWMGIRYGIMFGFRYRPGRAFFNDDYITAYGLSEFAFRGFQRRVLLERDFGKYLYPTAPYRGGDMIFMLSSMVDNREISEEKYREITLQSLQGYLKTTVELPGNTQRKLFIKQHPRTDMGSTYFIELMKEIRETLHGIVSVEMWDAGPVEGLLNDHQIALLAIDSSVLLYAALNDIESVCFQEAYMPYVTNDSVGRIKDVIPTELCAKIRFLNFS